MTELATDDDRPQTASEAPERVNDVDSFERLLRRLTGLDEALSNEVSKTLVTLFGRVGPARVISDVAIEADFYGRLNQKLVANRDVIAELYAACAARSLTFNYPTKRRLEWAINTSNVADLNRQLADLGVFTDLIVSIMPNMKPVTPAETRALLLRETQSPTKIRRATARVVAADVFNSAAGPLAWSLWPETVLVAAFADDPMPMSGDYMADLRAFKPRLFARTRSLVVRQVIPELRSAYLSQRDYLTQWLADEFEAIDNYGFLAILINVEEESAGSAWELASDLAFFAERFHQDLVTQMFFRWQEVRRETLEHVFDIDEEAARFDLINEGFTYRDTFVLYDQSDQVRRLLVLLQKNRRDETRVPCPGCRSDNVQGNSYPSLGVKSWECRNPLCTDRSIYNRGKRYDFRSLLKQEAIETEENLVPVKSVRAWQRDVLVFESDEQVFDMLLRHYSMRGDVIVLLDAKDVPPDAAGRTVSFDAEPGRSDSYDEFWTSPFFHRYIPVSSSRSGHTVDAAVADSASWQVLHGDALDILAGFPSDTFDRAVTSPPYFNAREYAQWPNLYCYLHDMHRIGSEVFRTLKPGGLYAYNIFDYFDNERIITFSDMGKKRLLLSAQMVDIFRRIGFDYLGGVVWDKGEIQGKRGFNAGNFSPFYQSPFNCWEHVLVVQKPPVDERSKARGHLLCLNKVVHLHPVMKMVRGENRLGHTAPYPIELVSALLSGLPTGALVLDPFGGSGTTAIAALESGHTSMLIERNETYFKLSEERITEYEAQLIARRSIQQLF